ncbi:serine/threonine-protein kinase [Streptomyces sp. NPDC051183]|uniref:serine/threonine-protein kinase n=1 Tax=Streptomyces sp. NPDC051183 TaxID=3155165 RepID=UPI0034173B21
MAVPGSGGRSLPARIGPYRPVHRIGSGGMGTVYFAYGHRSQPLAVKILHEDFAHDTEHRKRFAREISTLVKVQGPFLLPLIDADANAGRPWLATPYVPGHTLERYVRAHGPLTGANLLTFATATAHALACIHAAGVAHRDLKPANVILAQDGPRVLDFGIAHHLDATAVTRTRMTTGTPGWMAPEQFTAGRTVTASDVFTWGLLVAYAASGRHAFGTPTGIDHRIVHAQPDLSGIPAGLLTEVTAALSKNPDDRPDAVTLSGILADAHNPQGTLVFPTMAYTRVAGNPSPVRTLEPSDWSVPVPDTDLSRLFRSPYPRPGKAADPSVPYNPFQAPPEPPRPPGTRKRPGRAAWAIPVQG